jgi:hypothetical protein
MGRFLLLSRSRWPLPRGLKLTTLSMLTLIRTRLLLPFLVVGLSAGSLLFGVQAASAGRPPAQLASSYKGTFDNLSVNERGPNSFTDITENAAGDISGEWSAGGGNGCPSGPFTGTVTATSVTIDATTGSSCSDLVFTGTVKALGSKMSGTYTVVVDGTDTQNGAWKVSAAA